MRTIRPVPFGRYTPIAAAGPRGLATQCALAVLRPSCRLLAATVLAGLLASCTSPDRPSARLHNASPDQRNPGAHRSFPSFPSSTELSRSVLTPSAPTHTSNAPRLGDLLPPTASDDLDLEWVPLDAWAARYLNARPRPVGPTRTTWEMASPSGSLHIVTQSRLARYQGLDLWLGFAPDTDTRGLLVHRLDLAKNIRPLLLQSPSQRPPIGHVVIDPGHGGRNAGTSSVLDGGEEKHYTLDWALRLAPLLRAQGWTVTLTRTDDHELTLADRTALARAVQADLFLSLHFNSAAPNPTRSGIETYCLTPAGLPSTLVRESRENPQVSFANNRFDEMNLQWAARIHASLLQATQAVDRGIRRARFMAVLRDQECPAVLIEGGFLSHPAEARLIADPSHRQRLAEALAQALDPTARPFGGAGLPRLSSP